jgi:HK97 family phage major capsid protein
MPDQTLLEHLLDKRAALRDEAAVAIEKRDAERIEFEARQNDTEETKRPTDEERSAFATAEEAFRDAHQARMSEIKDLDQRIDEQELIEVRRQAAAEASRASVSVTSEPLTYRSDNAKEISYFADLAVAQVPAIASRMRDPDGALERLQRHAVEMKEELPKRDQAREERSQRQIDEAERSFTRSVAGVRQRGLDASPFERRVTPNRTDGQGGYFVPPLWLIDEFIPALRAGRVAAGLCRQMDLPEGTDSINIPKLANTTAVGAQSDTGAVTSQDLTDTSISAGVKTIAGQEDVALQLIEQSPGQIVDRVIMEDLLADYNRLVDRDVLYGQAGQNKITGIYPSTNWTAGTVATATAAASSGPAFNQTLGAMASKLATNRLSTENVHFLLHPRRWYWYGTALDGANGTVGRPIVGTDGFGPFNVSGLHDGGAAEGHVGRAAFGPHDIYASANVPITDNGSGALSGTFDVAIGAKWDDLWLLEGSLRTRVLPEVLSGTLEVRFQVYNYVAFLVRYGQSIVLAQGAGLAAPTGSIDTAMTF